MGLTKQYLRYSPTGNFNIIASTDCNIVFLTLEGQAGRFVGVGASENIIIWDLRLGEKAQVLEGDKHEVRFLAASPDCRHLAAGYADGMVKVFDLKTGENVTNFAGHRSAITCLSYDSAGHRLASASKDTDVIVWDVVAETGLHRLTGHKGVVTNVRFMTDHNFLISSSKDTFIKFWDLDTAHCFKTLVGHKSEVWGFELMKEDKYLVTGCNDNELRVWNITFREVHGDNSENIDSNVKHLNTEGFLTGEDVDNDMLSPIVCQKAGSLLRFGKGRVVSLSADSTGQVLCCHGTDNSLELYHFKSDEETQTRFKKRQRKEKKRLSRTEENCDPPETDTSLVPGLRDEVARLPVIKANGKIKSAHIIMGSQKELRVSVSLSNNCIELHSILGTNKEAECKCIRKISTQGHHSEIRSVCFSSDNLAVASSSAEAVKLWNRPSLACLRTVETGYGLCSCFAPGDRHLLVGMKDGQLLIIDIAAGEVLEAVPAHTKELWSVCLTPDSLGCVTGGDNTVKFWQFELVAAPDSKAKVLSLLHKRTLKLDEGVLAVKVSQNNKFLAVSLLDSTVKIFFADTLKFFVSLYGHKLPVLCMDISYDSTIIATGSADRNVKIWGLDFGDCHRSLFAHDDSVTGLMFVPKTHYFFTCGKDGRVKYWDADSFVKILTLQAHHGEAWALSVSANGQWVVSAGSDRVLRLFEKTAEPLVLEDEQEQEREQEDNNNLVTGEDTVVPGHVAPNLPSRKTVGSEQAAEQLLEALEVIKNYELQLQEHGASKGSAQTAPPLPLLMQAYKAANSNEFLFEVLQRIKSSELEEALLLLPFPSVCELLTLLPRLLKYSSYGTELASRVSVFLVRMHHGPIVSNRNLLPVLKQLQEITFRRLNELRDVVGYNLHGLQFVQRELEAKQSVQLFLDATLEKRSREKQRRKRERVAKRALLTM